MVSLVWAFSFGLIGNHLAGLPPAWVGWIRLALSTGVFLPFVRRVPWKIGLGLFATGAVQFGLMYLAYLTSFRFLKSHEVALFTVTTPILVALLSDLGARRWRPCNFLAASLAVGGAAILQWVELESTAPLIGFLLMQASNLCFAAGQLAYRVLMARLVPAMPDHRIFFWMHLGGFAVLTPMILTDRLGQELPVPTPMQWAILAYLGVMASGICFFLWNRGARFVSAGQLAVMNNLKIPLGVAVSLFVFREAADLRSFLAGALLVAVALLSVRKP